MKFEIPGLDVKKAMRFYDNDEEILFVVLRSFAANIPTTLNKLRDVSEEDLPNYKICIHGIKGTSANIGAEDIQNKAAELEALAKSGNTAELQKQNGGFIKQVEDLIQNINSWLDENDPE